LKSAVSRFGYPSECSEPDLSSEVEVGGEHLRTFSTENTLSVDTECGAIFGWNETVEDVFTRGQKSNADLVGKKIAVDLGERSADHCNLWNGLRSNKLLTEIVVGQTAHKASDMGIENDNPRRFNLT